MNNIRRWTLVSSVTLLLAGFTAHAHDVWTDNFEEAKAQASKDHKDLLLEFTGSDWCPYCIELRQKVFDTSEFKKEAPKSFVLVELDFPNNVQQSARVKKQNAELAETYGIGGYPTLILTDAQGEPYAQVSYNGVAEQVLPKLNDLHSHKAHRDELMAKAIKTSGVEKAKILDEVIAGKRGDEILPQYDDLLDQIVAADADNKAGLKAKYETRVELRPIIAKAQAGDVPGAIEALETKLKEKGATSLRKQELLYVKAILLQFSNQTASSIATLKEAHDQEPQSDRGKEIAGILAQIETAQK